MSRGPRREQTWYDWVVVERLWAGKWVGEEATRLPTKPEILALLARATREGVSDRQLAVQIGRAEWTVTRWRAYERSLRDGQEAGAVVRLTTPQQEPPPGVVDHHRSECG